MMRKATKRCASLVLELCLLLLPSLAAAQQVTTGGIAGIVRDTSGAVLPGVTVEAASPALIEKVRTAVTNGEGRYNIVGLQPGTYAVVFSLVGFNAVRFEGIGVNANFTATVNAELQVGALEETITVTAESPLVDTQNVTQQTRVSKDLLEALPSASMGGSVLINMTPGLTGTASIADVGGTAGYREGMGSNANNASYHGRQGLSYNIDGLSILSVLNEGTFSFVPNPLLLGEITVETGGSADNSGNGLALNAIPQEGGNAMHFMARGLFSNGAMSAGNLTDEWIARGIKEPGKLDYHYDAGFTAGGPIKRDKIWFFAAIKYQGTKNFDTDSYFNATQDSVLFTPDLNRPSFTDALQRSHAGRITWQASPRHKFNFLLDAQNNWVYRHPIATNSPEAKHRWNFDPSYITQVKWTMTASSRLLLEAAAGAAVSHWDTYLQPEVGPNNVRVTEQSTGRTYGMGEPRDPDLDERYNQRASLTYTTGSHNIKVGVTVEELRADYGLGFVPGGPPHKNVDIAYVFLNQRPLSITQNSRPYVTKDRISPDLAIFAQDQWAISRLSINYGLRFEYLKGHVPEQDVAATRFLPARHYDRVDDLPNWKDITPRVGVAYDVFGNSKTAVRFNFARYLRKEGTGIPNSLNPINTSVNSVTRTWSDTDGDFEPDCDLTNFNLNDECGPISNVNFGRPGVTTVWSDDVRTGFGSRPGNWDVSLELQQQIGAAMSVTAGYNRTWSNNFRVTDNLAVVPSDFDPFCVTAPVHPDLPDGGGYQVCGLFDVTPSKFGQVNNLVRPASDFGDPKRIANFFNLTIDTRFKTGLLLRGGIDTGRITTDKCFVIDSPQASYTAGLAATTANREAGLFQCRTAPPLMGNTQIKLQGSYPLPADIVVSAIFQNVPTVSYEATYRATNREIAPSLGRNLAACGTRTIETCTATVDVPLVQPGISFEDRRTQLDLRFTKFFQLNSKMRLQANVDIYNTLNSGALLTTTNAFGPSWRNPLDILDGRLFQFSGQLTF